MGLISKTAMMKWNSSIKKHYENLGYKYTKMGDEFEVKIEELTKGSSVKVNCKCDGCGKPLVWTYDNYNKRAKEDGSTYCHACSNKIVVSQKLQINKKTKSFYEWCIENNRGDLLLRWDYDLNDITPKEIGYKTNKKYWFKCDKHPKHKSELKRIEVIARDNKCSCNQCNSMAQWFIDNNLDINSYWDYEKNAEDPWEISCGSNKKVWMFCQEKEYHGSYETSCFRFASGVRCPYCGGKKVHPKDSLGQYIIDNYGEDFLHKVWSDKNDKTAFEYSPNSLKKVWWKCLNNEHEDYYRQCSSGTRFKYSCPKCYDSKGENNPNWNPNITQEERELGRNYESYRNWRKEVYKKDNYTCQCCGKSGVRLNAHHLNSYNWDKEHRVDVNNGITLCEDCHKEFHKIYGKGDNTKEQYEEWIKQKYYKGA